MSQIRSQSVAGAKGPLLIPTRPFLEVFHSDLRTDVKKKPDRRFLTPGEESFCLVFDSLAEAEAYSEAKVAEIPSLRCDIYDHLGKGKPPTLT